MALEYDLQQEIISYLTTPESMGGLGYKEEPKNTVNSSLFILKDLKNLMKLGKNEKNYKAVVMNDFKGNQDAFWKEFVEELDKYIQKRKMVSLILNQEKGFQFKNKYFTLYFKLDSLFEKNNLNLYSVVQELKIYSKDQTLTRKPDLTFFINGIMVSYCELKHNMTGQFSEDGIDKVITNYREFIKDYKDNHETDSSNLENHINTKMFHKTIHITSSDGIDTHVMRNMRDYQSKFCMLIKDNYASDSDIRDKIKKDFKLYPSHKEDGYERMKDTFKNIYSKESLDKEITIYNYSKTEGTNSILISPRPKQKHGVDRIIEEIERINYNSHNPNFHIDDFENKIRSYKNTLSESRIQELMNQQRKHLASEKFDSFICQYSAGFGKTNIMAWIALQLKNLLSKKYIQDVNFVKEHNYVYKKIMIVTDRLDLVKQFIGTLKHMNIKDSLFASVGDYKNGKKQKLIDLLVNDDIRICIVNVQKFNDILEGKFKTKEKRKLESMKVAFIIDEVHRTQTGTLNQNMTDLFSSVAGSLNNSIQSPYRNLLIGLTATPTKAILNRYGTFSGVVENNIERLPFDTFTMREAIEEGFVLDFTEHMYPFKVTINYDHIKYVKGQHRTLSRDDIYSNDEVIDKKADYIIEVLKNNTFKQIRNTASGMLVSNSIDNALKYRDVLLSKGINKENLYIVYNVSSTNQKHPKLEDINHIEKQKNKKYIDSLIEEFKKTSNNLIIVVDMLTTGFDAPKLHTLFLDKDVSGVNAIQTCSRVNRTTKNKNNCLIIDMSVDNRNLNETIPAAIKEFEGITYSSLDISKVISTLSSLDTKIRNHKVYKTYFKTFKSTTAAQDLTLKTTFANEVLKLETRELLESASDFCYNVNEFMGIVKGVDKYYRKDWFDFFKRLRNLIEEKNKKGLKPIDFIISSSGMSTEDVKEIENTVKDNRNNGGNKPKTEIDYLKIILRENKNAFEIEEKLKEFLDGKDFLFDEIKKDKIFMNHVNSLSSGTSSLEKTKADFNKKVRILSLTQGKIKPVLNDKYFKQYLNDFKELIFEDFLKNK